MRSPEVYLTAQTVPDDRLNGKHVVVIDVLRASSTIITALDNGARAIIPVGDMAEAGKIASNMDPALTVMGGERHGVKIEGYDLGNSPLEYSSQTVKGKNLIFNTTNGTKAVKKSVGASTVYIASFLNFSATVNALKKSKHDIVLVCAGWKGRLALEDTLLAGAIIYKLNNGHISDSAPDGAKVAHLLYEKYQDDIASVILQSNHAVRLKNLIGADDIEYCCQMDICSLTPRLQDGIITIDNG
jgi:2-phosphosulfolactate phosphatase